jgi:hypothetical protein
MISKCILLPYDGEDTCTAIIDKAEENIKTILKPNLAQILLALKPKMNKNGIVIFNGYARYFNTETDDCDTNQDWSLADWLPQNTFSPPLRLTRDHRKRFNDVVPAVNKAIKEVVAEVKGEVEYYLGFADWDLWAIEGVNGQMCDPKS